MKIRGGWKYLYPLLIFVIGGLLAEAEEGHPLAQRFSPRLGEINRLTLETQEALLLWPVVPVADQSGTGGFACLHGAPEPSSVSGFSVAVELSATETVDLVVLVPARRYGIGGLEAQFGVPDAFSVELLDPEGNVLRTLADETDVWSNPVRSGHPFVYPVDPPLKASGLRISARRLRLDPEITNKYVHAWAELFAFHGDLNLARAARVTSSGGSPPSAPWQWNYPFLVDEQTPLGIPEIPMDEPVRGGWISKPRQTAEDPIWIEVDLGQLRAFDAIHLIPAARPTSDLPSGFGFPRRFTISFPDGTDFVDAGKASDWEVATTNPGNNPFVVRFPAVRGRRVRIEFDALWKAYENFPAYAALCEVEVLRDGRNIARGAAVESSESSVRIGAAATGPLPAESTLTDGLGQKGRLVPTREWLLGLDRRLTLETQLYRLQQEKIAILDEWRIAGWVTLALLGGIGAVVLIILPVRYRLRERLHISQVRERIAGDLHDEVGSNLGSIQMLADLAEGHAGGTGPTKELKRIQRIAAETVSAVRDIVWLLRPQGDHRIGTVEHLRETSSIMLEPLEWEFTANEAAWQCEMSDEANRHLFLFFREALHNLLRHAGAKRATIRVECDSSRFQLVVTDDGCGISSEKLARPSTLRALRQRVEALGAEFKIETQSGEGTRLELGIPIDRKRKKKLAATTKPGIAPG